VNSKKVPLPTKEISILFFIVLKFSSSNVMKGNEMKYFYLSGNDISACIVSLMITRMITIQSQFEGWSQTVR